MYRKIVVSTAAPKATVYSPYKTLEREGKKGARETISACKRERRGEATATATLIISSLVSRRCRPSVGARGVKLSLKSVIESRMYGIYAGRRRWRAPPPPPPLGVGIIYIHIYILVYTCKTLTAVSAGEEQPSGDDDVDISSSDVYVRFFVPGCGGTQHPRREIGDGTGNKEGGRREIKQRERERKGATRESRTGRRIAGRLFVERGHERDIGGEGEGDMVKLVRGVCICLASMRVRPGCLSVMDMFREIYVPAGRLHADVYIFN